MNKHRHHDVFPPTQPTVYTSTGIRPLSEEETVDATLEAAYDNIPLTVCDKLLLAISAVAIVGTLVTIFWPK